MQVDVLDIINIAIMGVLLIEAVIFGRSMLRKYRETKKIVLLYFNLLIFILLIAGVFLFLQLICFTTLNNEPLGRIFGAVLLIPTTFAGIIVNLIAFQLTFTEKKKILIIPIIILVLIVDAVMAFAILAGPDQGYPWSDVVAAEFHYEPIIFITLLAFDIPVFFAPIGTFLYYSYKTRKTNPPSSKRSLLLAIALLLFSIPYVSEFIPEPKIITILLRSLYVVSATLLFICFFMPEWLKKLIGWEDEYT